MFSVNLIDQSLDIADIEFASRRLDKIKVLNPKTVSVIHENESFTENSERVKVEDFIKNIFDYEYGAHITVSYPSLISAIDSRGDIIAAMGYRDGVKKDFFLEQYIDKNTEDAIEAVSGKKVERSNIVEIGNLSSEGRGGAVFLFAATAEYLINRGTTHLVFTATEHLKKYFTLIGLEVIKLGEATVEKLKDKSSAKSWGSYYDTKPKVVSIDLTENLDAIRTAYGSRLLLRNMEPTLTVL